MIFACMQYTEYHIQILFHLRIPTGPKETEIYLSHESCPLNFASLSSNFLNLPLNQYNGQCNACISLKLIKVPFTLRRCRHGPAEF